MRVVGNKKAPKTKSQLLVLHMPNGTVRFPTGDVYRINTYRDERVLQYLKPMQNIIDAGARAELKDNFFIWAALKPMGNAYGYKHYHAFQDRDDRESFFYLNGDAVKTVLDMVLNDRLVVKDGWIEGEWRFYNSGGKISVYPCRSMQLDRELVDGDEQALKEEDILPILGR